jgi:hypothetical protein
MRRIGALPNVLLCFGRLKPIKSLRELLEVTPEAIVEDEESEDQEPRQQVRQKVEWNDNHQLVRTQRTKLHTASAVRFMVF